MIAYDLQHRRLTQVGRKKRINGPPPQPSLPAVRHAIVDLILRPLSQHTAEDESVKNSDVNKSAKVVLVWHQQAQRCIVSNALLAK